MSMHMNTVHTHTHRLLAVVTMQTLNKLSEKYPHKCAATQRRIPALIQSQVWSVLKVVPVYGLSKRHDPPERAGSN